MPRILLALFAAAACLAQSGAPTPPAGQPAPEAAQPRKTFVELARGILDDARATPVEIFAGLAGDSNSAGNLVGWLPREEQIQLYEDLYSRAGEAHQPAPMRYYGMHAPTTGPDQDRVTALGAQFDALSIRCRAIRALLRLDPKKARELFESMPPLDEPKGDCAQEFIPDASIYFETLAEVAESGAFTGEERDRGEPFLMVERGARSAVSSLDIVAAAKNLAKLAHGEKQAASLESALAASLGISDSDRSFTSAVRYGQLVTTVLSARQSLGAQGAQGGALLEALRGYLSRHLTGVRCRENAAEVDSHDYEIEAFNDALGDRTDIAPLGDGLKPSQWEDNSAPADYANKAEYDSLLAEETALASLVVEPGSFTLRASPGDPGAEPSLDDAQFRARQILYKIDDFSGAPGQDPMEVFHQKCRLLRTLSGAPLDADTERAVDSQALAVLEDPLMLNRSPAEWSMEFRSFVAARGMRNRNTGSAAAKSPESSGRQAALAGYLAAVNPGPTDSLVHSSLLAISVYARAQSLRAYWAPWFMLTQGFAGNR